MSKKTYLMVHLSTGCVVKIKTLDSEIYEGIESGAISVIDPKALTYLDEDLYWEDIPVQDESLEDDDEEEDEDLLS